MSRSKKDILDTEAMLHRLAATLYNASPNSDAHTVRTDAESLRLISMTLHRWHELECGDSNSFQSWVITRGNWAKHDPRRAPRQPDGSRWPKEFIHDDNGKPFMEYHAHNSNTVGYNAIPDREAGARRRLAAIMSRYPSLTAYVQGDPRGCALYILRPGDVPEGATVDSCYSRGLAVHQ